MPTLASSSTKKWALWGPAVIAVLQAVKLAPGVPQSTHGVIDTICTVIATITGGGVAWGMRNAVAKNGNGR
jgi:p-aminobenzoyl-glutamate transporter AbgT